MMDNLLIQKVWNDDFVMEFRIVGISHYVSAHQDCYLDMKCVENTSELLNEVCNGSIKECYIVWGIKEGPYTPAFSMKVMWKDKQGHLTIELDIEIADDTSRTHRCVFSISCEVGALERFANNLLNLSEARIGEFVSLYPIKTHSYLARS